MKYIDRVIEKVLDGYLKHFPVVGLVGPRQSGKSTLLREKLKDYQYVSFDDPELVLAFEQDPKKFLTIYSNRVIFDEVQYVPAIFNYIKLAVDNDRLNYGKFVLTGSSQFSFLKNVSESLAGRMGLLKLLPFQFSELNDELKNKSIYCGGYPELVLREYAFSSEWYKAYIDTYLTKDVRNLCNIGNLRDFLRLISLLAANASQILDMAKYANDIGVDVKTIKNWISILEASYIIFLVPPFYENFGKRIVKRPKVYFYDTGLLAHLTGIKTKELFERGPMAGAIFENYLIVEILKNSVHKNTNAKLYYYRTTHGVEVDLILDDGADKIFFEFKSSYTFRPKMLAPMEQIITDKNTGYLLYNGDDVPYVSNIHVMNYKNYLNQLS